MNHAMYAATCTQLMALTTRLALGDFMAKQEHGDIFISTDKSREKGSAQVRACIRALQWPYRTRTTRM